MRFAFAFIAVVGVAAAAGAAAAAAPQPPAPSATSPSPSPSPAPAPAPTSIPPPPASAWACTKRTLTDGAACTVEGRSAPGPKAPDLARENQRQARSIADEVCAALASGESADPSAGVLAVCTRKADIVTKRCGGDGTRRLVDDAGRFNPGHAKCYAALAEMVKDVAAVVDNGEACCACVHDSCNAGEEQCFQSIADERPPQVSAACLNGVCAMPCAQARLFAHSPTATATATATTATTATAKPAAAASKPATPAKPAPAPRTK